MTEPTDPQEVLPASASSDFVARWVFGAMTETLRAQIISLWVEEGAIVNVDEAWRRSWEVAALLVESASDRIVGACTVAIRVNDQGLSHGFVRLFIRPASRRFGLNRRLIKAVIKGFEAMVHQPGAPRRLIATIENRKFERRAAQRGLERLGFVQAGRTSAGAVIIERLLAGEK